MLVRVFRAEHGSGAEVLHADDLTRLGVTLSGLDATSADQVLRDSGLGELAGEHAWLAIERLRQAGDDDPQWNHDFAAMIRYAASRDWVDDTATRVRAHVEADPEADAGASPTAG